MKNLKKISLPKAVFVLSVVAAIYFSMLILGHKPLLPFSGEITFDMPTGACMTDSGEMLVADSTNTRLIFCNSDGRVCHIENLIGNNGACTAVGIFCIIFILLFAITTCRSPLARSKS